MSRLKQNSYGKPWFGCEWIRKIRPRLSLRRTISLSVGRNGQSSKEPQESKALMLEECDSWFFRRCLHTMGYSTTLLEEVCNLRGNTAYGQEIAS
uniref:Uncharacterized protein n=1 Tax=Acrobeloides nanus TaxID=290746 RepID=A0A914CUV8_9BILA